MKWNNPGNIRPSKDKWIGQTGTTKANNKGFVIFDSIANGYRAHIKTLQTYIGRGNDTINKIIPVWAPASDGNDPAAYIKTVVTLSGVDPSKKIARTDYQTLEKVVYAMSIVEKGNEARTPDAKAALTLAISRLQGTEPPSGTVTGSSSFNWLLIAAAAAAFYFINKGSGTA